MCRLLTSRLCRMRIWTKVCPPRYGGLPSYNSKTVLTSTGGSQPSSMLHPYPFHHRTARAYRLPSSIPKDIKATIRGRLLSAIDETSPQLAVQNAVVIGKISRQDYPLDWPDIFSQLTSIIRTCSENINHEMALKLTRALQIFLHVIKEQSSGKLPRMKSNLQTIAPEMFSVLGGVYVRVVDMWAPSGSPASELLTISLLCLKILRRLLVAGFEFPNRHENVGQFWQILQQHLASFINLTSGTTEYVQGVRKHVIHLGKIFLEVSKIHQHTFALMPGSIDLVKSYWSLVVAHGETLASSKPIGASGKRVTNGIQDEGDEEFREKVALHGMLLFWACVKAVYHQTQSYRCMQHIHTPLCISDFTANPIHRSSCAGETGASHSDRNIQVRAPEPRYHHKLYGGFGHKILYASKGRP